MKKLVPLGGDRRLSYVSFKDMWNEEIDDIILELSNNNVIGYLSKHDMAVLYHFSKQANTRILEIGTLVGLSSCFMALANRDIEILTMDKLSDGKFADPNLRNRDIWIGDVAKNIESVKEMQNIDDIRNNNLISLQIENVTLLSGYSFDLHEKTPDENDFIFIDGEHTAGSVFLDLLFYVPKIKSGGTILLHDNCWEYPGVNDAINSYVAKYGEEYLDGTIQCVNPNSSIAILKRR